MKICYFGMYNPEYSRNRVMIKGLKENGAEVIECRSNLSGLAKYFDLIKKHRQIKGKYDILIVGFPSNQSVVLAKFLTKSPIIMDAFVSLYDSMVFDRKICSPHGIKAWYYWFLDWLPSKLGNLILLDTSAHIDYFSNTFGINKKKFERVFVGTDQGEIYFDPVMKKEGDYFLVHFHGRFLPLQGIEFIVKAAKILERENVRFNIIGNGQEYKKIKNLVQNLKINNIEFIEPVPYAKLREYMSMADICLGIFGQSAKTGRVIPNKAYEAAACGKAIISAQGPAISEVFTDRENIVLCRAADENDLAAKILELKNNQDLRNRVGESAFNLYQEKLTPKAVTRGLFNKMKIWLKQ